MKHSYLDDKTIAIQCASTLRHLLELHDAGVDVEFPKELRETLYDSILDEAQRHSKMMTLRQVKHQIALRERFLT